MPGTWSSYTEALAKVDSLNKNGHVTCRLVYDPYTLSDLDEDVVIIGHSFGAYLALCTKGKNPVILINPVGLRYQLNRWGWWSGMLFKYRVLGIIGRFLGVPYMQCPRTIKVERHVSECISFGLFHCYWSHPAIEHLNDRPSHIVYSSHDWLIPVDHSIADTILPGGHEVECRVWVNLVENIMIGHKFNVKSVVKLRRVVVTRPWGALF